MIGNCDKLCPDRGHVPANLINKLFCFRIENQISICSCVSVLVEQIRSLFRCRIKLVVSLSIIWDYIIIIVVAYTMLPAWLMRTSIYILASLVTQRSCCCFWRFFTCKVGLVYCPNPTMRQLDRILIGWAPGNGKQSGHKSSMRSNRNSTAMTVTSTIISGRRAKSLIRGLNYEYSATGRVSQPASISAACENRVEYWPLVRTVDSCGNVYCMNWPFDHHRWRIVWLVGKIRSLFCQKVIDLGTRSIRNRSNRMVVGRWWCREDDWWARFTCDRTSWLCVYLLFLTASGRFNYTFPWVFNCV